MVGQRGVPATFGGVERAVEELGAELVRRGHEVVVYCRKGYGGFTGDSYRGMRLVHLPAPRSAGIEAFVHSGLATAHLLRHPPDVVHFHAIGPVCSLRSRATCDDFRSSRRFRVWTTSEESGGGPLVGSSMPVCGSVAGCPTQRSSCRTNSASSIKSGGNTRRPRSRTAYRRSKRRVATTRWQRSASSLALPPLSRPDRSGEGARSVDPCLSWGRLRRQARDRW